MIAAAHAPATALAAKTLAAHLHHLVMPGTLFRGEHRIHLFLHGIAHGLLHGLARGLLDFQDGPDLGLLFWTQPQHDRHALEVGIDIPARAAPAGTPVHLCPWRDPAASCRNSPVPARGQNSHRPGPWSRWSSP
jgi:hypothetical protein